MKEKDNLVRAVESRMLGMTELSTVYARAGEGQRGSTEVTEDTVGTIQFEFVDWRCAGGPPSSWTTSASARGTSPASSSR